MAAANCLNHGFTRRFVWAAYLIGFALGGFFDGILLHQILQWHHLLSGVGTAALRDLRVQVLADGVFHGFMYVVSATGLGMAYQSRREFTGTGADRTFLADLLIGFGIWHLADSLLSHWLTGIHRIRMDVPNPLAWDIVWLVLFGLFPLAIGVLMKRRYPRQTTIPDRRHGLAVVVAVTVLSGAWATLPPAGTRGIETVTVALRPGVLPAQFLSRLNESDVRVLWSDRAGGVWVLTAAKDISRLRYYQYGAMYVSGSLLPAGCSAWVKT